MVEDVSFLSFYHDLSGKGGLFPHWRGIWRCKISCKVVFYMKAIRAFLNSDNLGKKWKIIIVWRYMHKIEWDIFIIFSQFFGVT